MESQAKSSEDKSSRKVQGPRRRFQWRALASVMSALTFIAMSITGLALFVTPPGRVAHWTGWTLAGLTKDQWGALHIWFSLVFMIAALFHLYLNWRPMVSYFKDRLGKAFALRWEWVLSLAICVLVFWGTLADITPFSNVMAWNEQIKFSWEEPAQRAPIPHAELLTIGELAEKTEDLDAETMLRTLRESGIEVESAEVVLGELAEQNGMTPNRLYNLATGQQGSGAGGGGRGLGGRGGHGGSGAGSGFGGGRGMGRLTLQQYCDQEGLDIQTAVERLQEQGLEAKPTMTIRDIAATGNLHPSVLRDVLQP